MMDCLRSASLIAVLLMGSATLATGQVRPAAARAFPHEKHARLFPTCLGCHAGAVTSDTARLMPPASSCTACHNGSDAAPVSYEGRRPRSGFLRFAHTTHAAEVPEEGRRCAACHGEGAEPPAMAVAAAAPGACQGCHTHRASAHLAADNRCQTCHVVVTAVARLSAPELDAFPRPPSHADSLFIRTHATSGDSRMSQCAFCHARQSCARCHVNAAAVPSIASLRPDARFAALLRGRPPTYFTPADHAKEAWSSDHGVAASSGALGCASCHAQPSCIVCHTGTSGRQVIRQLPDGRSGAPGVRLERGPRLEHVQHAAAVPVHPLIREELAHRSGGDTLRFTVRVHAEGFEKTHGAFAASARLTCEGCHTQQFCGACHAGESARRFHPANFVTRHAPESYARDLECQSCHSTEVFCRACHEASGLAPGNARAGAYHNAQPLWLLQHGGAARQGLESCVTCHAQRDCLQCHATTGWGVSPHGPGFDARRLGARARVMCARCHITDPTGSR